jgi:peptidyl-prolyl cis-trans isomerase C
VSRGARALLLVAIACAAGLACSEVLYRWPTSRALVTGALGRGELAAIVEGAGIYDVDDAEAARLIIETNLRRAAHAEQMDPKAVVRDVQLLGYQFGDAKAFDAELERSGTSLESLSAMSADHLRARQWIENQIASELRVTEEESRAFYEANQEAFAQPARFRVSHLFLAAPETAPPEVVKAKGDAIQALSKRIGKGENFAQLVAEASEDEATKGRGGDLSFFSVARMPEELIAEVEKLAPGKPSAPVRTPLGFHILQLADTRPARQLSFDEVRGEIALHLTNRKRAAAVEKLRQQLTTAEFVRTPL